MAALPDGSYVEAFVGYRSWRIAPANGTVDLHPLSAGGFKAYALSSRQRTHRWEPHTILTASCLCDNHERAPRCGFHAWMTQPRVILNRPNLVWGEAYLWGEVGIFERGYRAEHAMVAALYVYEGMDDRARRLIELAALQYDVPVVGTDLVKLGWSGSRLTA